MNQIDKCEKNLAMLQVKLVEFQARLGTTKIALSTLQGELNNAETAHGEALAAGTTSVFERGRIDKIEVGLKDNSALDKALKYQRDFLEGEIERAKDELAAAIEEKCEAARHRELVALVKLPFYEFVARVPDFDGLSNQPGTIGGFLNSIARVIRYDAGIAERLHELAEGLEK